MKFIEKAKLFWEKNKKPIVHGLCIVGGIVSGAIIAKAIIEAPSGNYSNPVCNDSVPDDRYEWDDDKYKDDWEKLSIAANYLDLEEGESYVISSLDGVADDEDAVNIGNVYLTHYIDDVAVNPPEDEEDDDDEEDEEDEEDCEDDEDEEDCEEIKIKVPKDADDDVRQLVQDFIDLIENGDIEIVHF